jgi:multimeric flavodoxin WrbA
MKRVTAFVGTATKRHTYRAVEQFLSVLRSLGDVETELVRLSDYHIEVCKGCRVCLDKGEELCRLVDDRDLLIGKMMASDGVVFASPNYSFHVSGMMKLFLDRLAFIFHRPRFFGKTFTSIVVQGIYGGNKIVSYFNFIAGAMGFNTVKGACIMAMEPLLEKQQQKIDQQLAELSKRFYKRLVQPAYPAPSLFALMVFRMGRTSRKLLLDDTSRDYTYMRDKGWFASDYYYPTHVGPLKAAAGKLFDWAGTRLAASRFGNR